MLATQLIQHLGVGGIARLGLLHRGQAQLVEEDLAQLLGGVDIKGLPGQFVNLGLGSVDASGEHLPEADQGAPVDEEALMLHLGQHGAKGQLHVPVEGAHPQLLQPLGQGVLQGVDEGGVG